MTWPAVETEPMAESELRQQEGQAFHRLLHQHLLGMPVGKLESLTATPSLQHWWHNYVSTDFGLAGYTLRAELQLSAPLGEHRLVAKYDLIAVRQGHAIIYDWKTYARRPRDEWLAARWQTRVYRALLARAGADLNNGQPFDPRNIKMLYWFAEYPAEAAEFGYSAEQLKRDWSAIETLAQEILSARTFPLTQDLAMCRFCVYRSLCGRGDQAGLLQDAHAEATDNEAVDIDFEQIAEIEY